MSNAPPFCYALWCDDVRQELGNKPSFMGVYTGGLVVPALPFTLARLSTCVVLSVPMETPLNDVTVTVARDDGVVLAGVPIFNATVPDLAQLANGVPATRHQLMFIMTLVPLALPENCKYLHATVTVGDRVFETSKLHIQTAPPAA